MSVADIVFRFRANNLSYATTILKAAVLRPVCGELRTERQTYAAFNKLLDLWRAQLSALHTAGLSISTAKIMRARNCPPPGSGGKYKLQPCRLRICPFCYVRRLLCMRERIAIAHKQLTTARLVTYTLLIDDPTKVSEQLICDAMTDCCFAIADIVDTHKRVRERIRARICPSAYGTISMFHSVPHAFKEVTGSRIGYVTTFHSCLGLVPKHVILDAPSQGKLFERNYFTQRMLLYVLAKLFTYPAGWLRADPHLMVEFLAATRKQRLLTRTGVLRDVKI